MSTFWYDSLYYGVCVAMAGLLLVTLVQSLGVYRSSDEPVRRGYALGILAAALGTELAFMAGVSLNAIRSATGDLFYQEVHFAVDYVGFALITFGVIVVLDAARAGDARKLPAWIWPSVPLVLWLAYAGATAVATSALLAARPSSLASAGSQAHVSQQVVYFLPIFETTAIGAMILLGLVVLDVVSGWRRQSTIALGLFAGLAFVGFLRESTIIPSSGEPYLDLFMAFGPFILAVVSLFLGARFIERERVAAGQVPDG